MRRVTDLKQVLDIVRGLTAPHAVTEHHGSFGVGEVEQSFGFTDIEYILQDLSDFDGRRTISWNEFLSHIHI